MAKKSRKMSSNRAKVSLSMRIWRIVYRMVLCFFLFTIVWVLALKYIPIYFTPLMVRRSCSAILKAELPRNKKHWVPLNEISPDLTIACVSSEDNLFIKHNGFSEKAIRAALEDNKKGKPLRGGSTISQQTAKNVFTFGTRTWVRKGFETYFTILIEWMWGKERIMEVYLNVVELGDGIYGAEAASQHYYSKSAIKLTKSQCALFAAALPSPRKYSIAKPGPYMQRRKRQILNLMPKMARIDFLYPHKENEK